VFDPCSQRELFRKQGSLSFFQNEKVNPNAILGKHVENNLDRAKAWSSVVSLLAHLLAISIWAKNAKFGSF
jgi:hypothetical protein